MPPRRSLGGGRVLGSGDDLPSSPLSVSTHSRSHVVDKTQQRTADAGLNSPFASSPSLDSQASFHHEDLSSRVASREDSPLPIPGQNTCTITTRGRLVCPICAEEMLTLLQLNRHLDDNHQNLEELEQDEVKNWFEQQVRKAKKFQPLAVLNQRLRGLDVFEPNSTASTPMPSRSAGSTVAPRPSSRQSSPAPDVRSIDPDDVVQNSHWQRSTGYDLCVDPACGRRLGGSNGLVNCRHCGRLFCDEHTMYQMRLSRSAKHEPVRGFWCRVCETCYKSREGYNDHSGSQRLITNAFLSARKRVVDKATLDVSRLEKRLTKLTHLLANPPPPPDREPGATGFLWSMTTTKTNHLRLLEQSVVAWETDAGVAQCPFCHQPFTQYTFRRHHCRICGRVVCADLNTACSSEIALHADKLPTDNSTDQMGVEKVPLDIRMCKECQHTLFCRSDFDSQISAQAVHQRAFNNLCQFEAGIRALLPKFQRLLQALQNPDPPPTAAQLTEATKIRKRLTEAFARYDTAARRVRDMPTDSPTQQRLGRAVYAQAASFLHLHMLPLKHLPKILRNHQANGRHLAGPQSAILRTSSPLALSRRDSSASTSTTDTTSAAISALEGEERELRERMIVLEEQRFLVQGMLDEAKKKRRLDEAAALTGNVDDLSREIDSLQGRLTGLDWRGVYTGTPTGTPPLGMIG